MRRGEWQIKEPGVGPGGIRRWVWRCACRRERRRGRWEARWPRKRATRRQVRTGGRESTQRGSWWWCSGTARFCMKKPWNSQRILRLFALNPAYVCEISVLFFVFRCTLAWSTVLLFSSLPVFNFSNRNNKSEPMTNRQKVRIILFWISLIIMIRFPKVSFGFTQKMKLLSRKWNSLLGLKLC